MEVELLEIRDFLSDVPPFDALSPDALDRLPPSLSIRYLRRGAPFPPAGAEGRFLYVVRQGAVELRNDRDEVVAKYGEGDLHAAECLEEEPALPGFAVEDTLLYLVPCRAVAELRAAYPAFDQHFSRSLRDKLRRSLDALQSSPALGGGLLAVDVGSLVSGPPIHVSPELSIREAAAMMTAKRVSSLLVMRGERLEGIVTDRDMRRRCLAEGVPAERPVGEIMTPRVQVIAPDVPGFEALLAMTRLGVHHLPVVDRGRVLGMITTTDLVRHQGASTVYLVGAVRRGGSVAELVQATTRLPEMQVQMVAAGATPRHLGQAVGAVVDALTRRLLQLAEGELGPAPCAYAWLAFGSQARHEQSVLSDQDNGLLLADDGAADDPWFERLARFVNDGLHACGFSRCPGNVMASNPMWRQPLRGWRRHFDGWIERPEAKALMHAALFFDLRAAAGDESLALALQAHVLARLRGNEVVLALLAANALRNVPPLGFFRGFVLVRGDEHADTLDLKRGGMMPIVELARIHALAAGSTALGTVERLREAAERRTLSRGGAEDLEDALAFVSTLRARHQAEQIKRGLPPDNHVRPDELSPLERSQLKDAFAVIRRQQEALAQVYRARSFV